MTVSGEDDENRPHRPSSPWPGMAALGVLLLAAVASCMALLPVAPQAANAPADEFSAGRAMAHVTQVARAPRPVGSPHHEWARGYLADQLRSLGWTVELQEAVGTSDLGTGPTRPVAAVSNIIATLPGRAPTGSVVLAAHYDTVAGSPGAGDDGIGLGVVLEAARALTAQQAAQPGPQRNDVVALLTDAEEPGLLGAEAFARERAPALGTAVVLNHEARGAAGSPFVLRMTAPNGVLAGTLGRAPGPLAESAMQATFDMLPYGTDFTQFESARLSVIDTVISAGAAHYHTPVDAAEHLSAASMQQMGDNTLAVARQLADMDLATVEGGGQDIVTTLPWGLLRYPASLEVPVAVAALVLAVAVVGVERRRRALTLPTALLAAMVGAVTLAAAAAAGVAVWRVAVVVDPAQASVVTGEPYRPVPYQVAVLLATAAVVVLVPGLLRRRLGPRAFDSGCLLGFAGLGLLAALTVPGTSYTLVLPTLTTAAAVLAAALMPGLRPLARALVLLLGLVPAAVMLGPAVWLGFEGGIGLAGPTSAALLAVLLLLTLPVLQPGQHLRERRRRRSPVPVLAATCLVTVIAAAATGAGLFANRPSATPPRQEAAMYSLDSGTGEARWASWAAPRSDWSRALLTHEPATLEAAFPRFTGEELWHGPAPAALLPAPQLGVLSDTIADGVRELTLRLSSPRGARSVGLWVDAGTATVRRAVVAGRDLATTGRHGPWDFGFVFEGAPPDGVEVRLTVEQHAAEVELLVADRTDDLGAVPGFRPPQERVVAYPEVTVTSRVTV